MTDRLPLLLEALTKEVNDPFTYYALALEYQSRGNSREACAYFEMLLTDFPAYVPAYQMYGSLLAGSGENEKALSVLRKGIETANNAGEKHAASEMNELLHNLTNE